MIPLRDNIPSRSVPVVNYGLIAVCSLVFLIQMSDDQGQILLRYSMVPARVTHPEETFTIRQPAVVRTPSGPMEVIQDVRLPPAALPGWGTLLSCVFLHGSLLHLLSNMWFLMIFGDNVEDRLGHWGYLVFFLGCGLAASFAHYAAESESLMPTVGASGAVAGVMGAYLLLYPHAMVLSLVPILFILQMIVIPAPVFLGLWFLLQLLQGTFAMGRTEAAGVAWWAHVGGFVAGWLVARVLTLTGRTRPQVTVVRPGSERSSVYRLRRPGA